MAMVELESYRLLTQKIENLDINCSQDKKFSEKLKKIKYF